MVNLRHETAVALNGIDVTFSARSADLPAQSDRSTVLVN